MNEAHDRLTWRATRRLIGRDMEAYGAWPLAFGAWRAGRPRWLFFLWLCATQHMFPATVLFRLQCYLFERGLPWAATAVSRLNHTLFGVTIGHHVRAGGALYLAHGHVVIDGAVQLGEGVEIAPFVTLGLVNSASKGFTLQGPVIGDAVNIGTGAKVLGPVCIGSHV
jgi:serine O-acetyltransferase